MSNLIFVIVLYLSPHCDDHNADIPSGKTLNLEKDLKSDLHVFV